MRKWISRAVLIAWMCVIFSFSAQNGGESSGLSGKIGSCIVNTVDSVLGLNMTQDEKELAVEKLSFPIRKAAHMLEYAILALLAYLSFSKYAITIIITFVYAMTDELHQRFVPGRAGMFTDVLIDTAGGLIMVGVLWCIAAIRNKSLNRKR